MVRTKDSWRARRSHARLISTSFRDIHRWAETFIVGKAKLFFVQRAVGIVCDQRARAWLHATPAGDQTRLCAALLNQLGDQSGPPGLVAGAQSRAVVAMEVFVKEDV